MPPAAGGSLDRWRVVGIPGCRTHARTPSAPTSRRHVHAKTNSGSRSAEYVNQLSTSSVLCFLVRRVARPPPLAAIFRRPFSTLPACACSRPFRFRMFRYLSNESQSCRRATAFLSNVIQHKADRSPFDFNPGETQRRKVIQMVHT